MNCYNNRPKEGCPFQQNKGYNGQNSYGCGGVEPIFAPKRVCTTCVNQYVEQPVICPIECRRVNNIVYYPRYYPQYEQTCYTQDNNTFF